MDESKKCFKTGIYLYRVWKELMIFNGILMVLLKSIAYFSNILPDYPKIGTLSVYS